MIVWEASHWNPMVCIMDKNLERHLAKPVCWASDISPFGFVYVGY